MRFYAERPLRLLRQLIADAVVIAWMYLCVQVAFTAQEVILRLQAPAQALADAGGSIRGAFDDAARTASGVPFVGEDLARALGTGTNAGDSLASAGREQVETIAAVALGTTIGIIVLGALPVLLVWLPLRMRYARAARSAAAVRGVDTDLLALRAMTRLPVRKLLAVSSDPAAAWRRDERAVVHKLAELELKSLGMRAPRTPPD
ncbi:hypothetical protein [Pseudonocardia sp. TRM90224]|uniref:hypothetical protein n=1 Tax=Pseudonocardia sp. TRM90224 TaxID=2812678 RepID=UPI001E3BA57A|nr:hypothetical protein [Pseudonocardia sp. TRM90224]